MESETRALEEPLRVKKDEKRQHRTEPGVLKNDYSDDEPQFSDEEDEELQENPSTLQQEQPPPKKIGGLYHCPFCPTTFASIPLYTRHIPAHSDETPYHCPFPGCTSQIHVSC